MISLFLQNMKKQFSKDHVLDYFSLKANGTTKEQKYCILVKVILKKIRTQNMFHACILENCNSLNECFLQLVGRILRWPLRSPSPSVHILNNPFSLHVNRFGNMMRFSSCDYVSLYGRRDFADVVKIPSQLTLRQSKERLLGMSLP